MGDSTARRELEESYRLLFEAHPHPMFVVDLETLGLLAVNEAAIRKYGWPREAFLSMSIRDIRPPEEIPRLLKAVSSAHDGRDPEGPYVHRTRDGATFPVDIHAHSLVFEGRPARLVMAQDVTDRVQAEEELRNVHQELEKRVEDRTAQLRAEVADRTRTEGELRESEERWRSLVEHSPDIILTADREGKILFINRVVPGFRREEVTGTSIYDYAPPASRRIMKEALERIFTTGNSDQYETLGDGPHRKPTWYSSRMSPLFRGGKVVAVMIVATEITLRRRAEGELREQTQRLRVLTENVPAVLWTVDLDLKFTSSVGTGLAALNLKPNEAVGMTLQQYFQLDDPEFEPIAAHRRALRGESVRFETSWGGHTWGSHLEPLRDSSGSIVGVIGVALNLTGRKRTEAELLYQKTLLEAQREASIEGILVVDDKGKMISLNRRFVRMWGIPEDVVASESDEAALQSVLHKLVDPEGFLAKVRKLYAAPMEESRDELKLKDGRTFDRYSAPVRDRGGVQYGRVWFFRDVTERKRAEAELRRAAVETKRAFEDLKSAQAQLIRSEKLASIGMLVSGVAHELNNPLNVMYGNLKLLAEECKSGPPRAGTAKERKLKGMIRDALKAAEHAKGVVEDFRGFARDVRTAESVDLNRCLEEALALVRRELRPKIRLVKRLGRIPPVRCLRGQMSQVFLNLLSNAHEAIEGAGTITLTSRRRNGRVVFEISDTGRGMDEEVQRNLFEPFYTTKAPGQGLGLGLSISAMILQNHGGEISCKSRPGKGSSFRLELPIAGRP